MTECQNFVQTVTPNRHTLQLPIPMNNALAAASDVSIVRATSFQSAVQVSQQQQNHRNKSAPHALAQTQLSSCPAGPMERTTSNRSKLKNKHVQFGRQYSIGSTEDLEGKRISQVMATKRNMQKEQWRAEQRLCGVDVDGSPCFSDSDDDGFGSEGDFPRGRGRTQTLDNTFDFENEDTSDRPYEYGCRRPRARSEPIF